MRGQQKQYASVRSALIGNQESDSTSENYETPRPKGVSAEIINLADPTWKPSPDFELLHLFQPARVAQLPGKRFLVLVDKIQLSTELYFKDKNVLDGKFFDYHKSNSLPYDQPSLLPKDCFFSKWYRPVLQEDQSRYIEDRIATGRPYDKDLVENPALIGLNHTQFRRSPAIFREYEPLEARPHVLRGPKGAGGASNAASVLSCAALECVSCYFTNVHDVQVGIVVFDDPRVLIQEEHRYQASAEGFSDTRGKTTTTTCFKDDIRFLEQFKKQLQKDVVVAGYDGSNEYSLARLVRSILLRTILDDTFEVLSGIDGSLDAISLAMSLDEHVRDSEQGWRDLFGKWKNGLTRQGKSIEYGIKSIRHSQTAISVFNESSADPPPGSSRQAIPQSIPSFLQELKGIKEDVDKALRRTEATFNSLMATMSIIESRRAIAQAESVTKLTSLAFFFIPLTLCATVFSINVVEFEGVLKAWMWGVTSLSVTTMTYTLLYWNEIFDFIARSPSMIQTLGFKRLQIIFLLLAYGVRTTSVLLIAPLVVATAIGFLLSGLGIRFWGLPTDTGRTLAISLGMAIGTTGLIMTLMLYRSMVHRRKQGYDPRPPGIQRIPPDQLFGSVGRSASSKVMI